MRNSTEGQERVERRLAAILAADVVGYSRLMGEDEEGTLERLKAHRLQLVDPKIREHRGRIVKTTGDGMLVEFASVVDAVRCAVELQRGMVDRNSDIREDRRICFRVGINLGDVIIDGDDIHGDGVNIAARLENLADRGGICVSRMVLDQVRDKLPYIFEDMGEQSVKNIARPVPVYAISSAAIALTPLVPLMTGQGGTPAIEIASPKSAPRMSIVVLPFANLSNDPEQEYFADAITDDLTTDLSRISGSFVIARTTAFTYRGQTVDAKQIGQDLGVRYVLEGSVRRLGEQVRVNVQLIDADSGAHLWADRFDTDRRNLAIAQGEITSRLARTLQLELIEAVGRQIDQEKNPDARDLIMRGWAALNRPETPENLRNTQQIFECALALDRESVEARVGIAQVLLELAVIAASEDPEADKERAEALLSEALARNRNFARLHWALGFLRRLQGRAEESRIEFDTALSLNPNDAGAMLQLGYTLVVLCQPSAALPYFEKAIRLTPRHENIYFYYAGLGSCYLYLGCPDQAIEVLRKARASNARFYWTYLWLAAAHGLRGDIDEAKAALDEMLKINPRLRSLAEVHRSEPTFRRSDFQQLCESTLNAGLRYAGLPEE